MVAFLIFAVTDFMGLVWGPTLVVPGIQGIESGQTVNSAIDFNGNWSFDAWSSGSSGSYQATGGNLDGYLEMRLFGSGARGFWMQPFEVRGSMPFAGVVRLDIQIAGGLNAGRLLVSVDSSASVPDPATAIANRPFSGPVPWTTTARFDATARLSTPGTYYLKVAFIADTASGPVDVGFDNIRLAWTTDAGVFFYVPLPTPVVVFVSQDKSFFIGYYGLVIAAILLAAGYHAIRERKEAWDTIRAPFQAIGRRLRSHSAWIAIAQAWMAVTFFQIAFILVLVLADIPTPTPITIDANNAWVFLFGFANAGVYEEFAFRVLLIGLPMALGSLALRIMEVNRGGGTWNAPGSAGRHIAGAWRYLIGGSVHSDAPRETLVAAWAFLFASSAIFGLAHAPGWGWWKVVPATVAGLGFGYLFLRHGIGAAILAHFVTDYTGALTYPGVGGGPGLEVFIVLVFFGLAIAGAGFFAWYMIDAWRHFKDLVARFGPPTKVRPAAAAYAPGLFPAAGSQPLTAPAAAPSSAPMGPGWPQPPPTASPPAAAVRDQGRIPRDYTPSYVPPPYGYPPVRFQCPSCGWVEARYEGGRFTCTRCGRTA